MNDQIKNIVDNAKRIVILQADNPDADSLGSALALEQILSNAGKDVYLYCAVDIPNYLRYLSGWDRINSDIPSQFDASIIVDASTLSLFERLTESGSQGWVASKPCVVLDHHNTTDNSITFANVILNEPGKSSTGEVIYTLAKALDWPLDDVAGAFLMTSILGDTQGLTNDLTKPETYRVMADLAELGVNRPILEEQRREASKMEQVIYKYKATLIDRTEFHHDNQIATVSIPQVEINEYSPLYNPGPLIQGDMLQVKGLRVGIVFKTYDDGRVTGMIRCNPNAPIGALIAKQFGGGGHDYASGFKITSGKPFNEIKSECIEFATQLLNNLDKE